MVLFHILCEMQKWTLHISCDSFFLSHLVVHVSLPLSAVCLGSFCPTLFLGYYFHSLSYSLLSLVSLFSVLFGCFSSVLAMSLCVCLNLLALSLCFSQLFLSLSSFPLNHFEFQYL